MRMIKRSAIGAPDLSLEALLGTLEGILRQRGYFLEWQPGAVVDRFGVSPLQATWMFESGKGAWLILPEKSHGRHIAGDLVRSLDRALIHHAVTWYSGPGDGDLNVVSNDWLPDGQTRPRDNGPRFLNLDRLVEGAAEQAVSELLRHLIGIWKSDQPGGFQHDFSLYEISGDGIQPPVDGDSGTVNVERVAQILDRLRGLRGHAVLGRDSPKYYLVTLPRDAIFGEHIYLNPASAEKLLREAHAAGLPLRGPSVWGLHSPRAERDVSDRHEPLRSSLQPPG